MTKRERLRIESKVISLFNEVNGIESHKKRLQVGNAGATHEFDLYESGRVIGGVSTSPWTNKTKRRSTKTAGQDRVSSELLWLSLWGGLERRVMVLTDIEMARRLHERFKGCPFPKHIEVVHCDPRKGQLNAVGRLPE